MQYTWAVRERHMRGTIAWRQQRYYYVLMPGLNQPEPERSTTSTHIGCSMLCSGWGIQVAPPPTHPHPQRTSAGLKEWARLLHLGLRLARAPPWGHGHAVCGMVTMATTQR